MQKTNRWQTAVIGVVAMLVAIGCGGGSSNSVVSTEVEILSDADAVVYETGDGVWKDDLVAEAVSVNGKKRYTFEHSGKYGVALYCKNTGDEGVTLFQLSTADSRSVILKCSKGDGSTITGTVTDTTAVSGQAHGYAVAMGRDWVMSSSAPYAYTMSVTHGLRDLIVTSLGTSGPLRFYIERDIDFTGPDTAHTVALNDTNSHTISAYNVSVENLSKGYIKLVSDNDTLFTVRDGGKWYIPDSGLIANDLYLFYGLSMPNKTGYLKIYGAENIPKQDIHINAGYISILQGTSYDKTDRKFGGLAYLPSAQSQALKFYMLSLKKNTKWYKVILSSAWLDHANEYQVPDLSALQGFGTVWQGLNPAEAIAEVYMSDGSIEAMLKAERVYMPYPSFFPLVPDITYETAFEKIF